MKRKASTAKAGASKSARTAGTRRAARTTAPPPSPAPAPPPATPPPPLPSVVPRPFYPPEMTNERAQRYVDGELPTPLEELTAALDEHAGAAAAQHGPTGAAVVHWFRADLRVRDNRALAQAGAKARALGVPLVGVFLASAQDWAAHATGAARVDLVRRTLAVLRADLAALGVPLWVEAVEAVDTDHPGERQRRQAVVDALLRRLVAWDARWVFANTEYEVDELRRDAAAARACAAAGRALVAVADTCVVPPGTLRTGGGRPYAVFTPWFRAWTRHVHAHEELVDLDDAPAAQDGVRDGPLGGLFDCPIPAAPADRRLDAEAAAHLAALWPAGEHEAAQRLEAFCAGRLAAYAARRDEPAADATSALSPYLACGALSARTALHAACRQAGTAALDDARPALAGFRAWVRELAWRDFYRHVLAAWPHVCMFKPLRLGLGDLAWAQDGAGFAAWTAGRTGFPLVDAAMRQLARDGWMPNRCRMVVASFLAKDLRLDWRLGERLFLERLVDGDWASNNGGWAWAAGVGADPQPFFRVFHPRRQSERFDAQGAYIRAWVPELRGAAFAGDVVHAPYERGAGEAARAAGYPEPMVDHAAARAAALEMYRA